MSAFAHVASLGPQPIWDGILARTVSGDGVALSLLGLGAGGGVPEHAQAHEQVGMLLEGTFTFTIGGESRDLGPGAAWTIRGDVPHSVTVGPEGAVIVEAFSPVRDDWHAIEEQEPRPG